MRLTTAAVDRYGPLSNCHPPCEDGVTVLSGPNEAGKTLYLEAVLQLLEPGVRDVMSPEPRVSQEPAGRVVVEHGGTRHECGGETSLCDVTAIEPAHLQSVFVVQDNDLELPGEQAYYTSLIEKLGDIHTTEINAIKSELKDCGRLTDRRRNVSSDRSVDNAGDVRDDADALADDVRTYVDQIDAEGLGELDARRLRCKRQLRTAQEQLASQRAAKTVAAYERLSAQLDSYRTASDRLTELDGFDRETLEELRELHRNLERDRERQDELATDIDEQTTEVNAVADELDDLEDRLGTLERRESNVEDAHSTLETYRDRRTEAGGAERRLVLTKYAMVAGLLAAGGAGAAGAITGSLPVITFGVVLFVAAVGSGLLYRRANRRLTAVETGRDRVLQSARDGGLDVSAVEDVAPAIESFESELAQVRERVAKREQALQNAEEALEELRAEQAELKREVSEDERRQAKLLEAAEVASIDEYETRVERRAELKQEQQTARQSLVDRFGDPDTDDPESRADAWERDLEGLVADVNLDAVDAEAYDEARLGELESDVETLQEEVAQLADRLAEHDERLDTFDQRARELTTRPFVGDNLGLDSRSRDGLEALAADLEDVVAQIEADADRSRKALEVFDRIEVQEEQKLTELFDPQGPASRTFEQLTGGRYTAVAYDPDAHELEVERRDGRTFSPELLSQGTTDQLYFSTRVSLAQQLLGNEPGFLLLDDPFLAADHERLHEGFRTLQALAADGWQILYFTAKREVSETMVEEFGLTHSELGSVGSL